MKKSAIHIARPDMPAMEDFLPMLEEIWTSGHLTNHGQFHRRLEKELSNYLGVEHICLTANGTLALLNAIYALKLDGEIITTPYSFVATSNAIIRSGLTPVFVDIEPDGFNLASEKIEAAITERTSAILAVHCYGYPCNTEGIQRIAKRHNLRIIYDAAHAFGVKDGLGKSILHHGDLSILSFHATKIFSTLEGGAIICPDLSTKRRIDSMNNFGFVNETSLVEFGINAKMNEVQAAFGLLSLKKIDQRISARAKIDQLYRRRLAGVKGIFCPKPSLDTQYNHAYFPIIVSDDYPWSRDELLVRLKVEGINARRYFYPIISSLPIYQKDIITCRDDLYNAERISRQILCLPIYPQLQILEIDRILGVVASAHLNSKKESGDVVPLERQEMVLKSIWSAIDLSEAYKIKNDLKKARHYWLLGMKRSCNTKYKVWDKTGDLFVLFSPVKGRFILQKHSLPGIALYVYDESDTYYLINAEYIAGMIESLSKKEKIRRIVLIGHSKGGFAALLIGALLVKRKIYSASIKVLSLSPQIQLHPHNSNLDVLPSYEALREKAAYNSHVGNLLEMYGDVSILCKAAPELDALLIYGRHYQRDAVEVEHMSQTHVKYRSLDYSGHNTLMCTTIPKDCTPEIIKQKYKDLLEDNEDMQALEICDKDQLVEEMIRLHVGGQYSLDHLLEDILHAKKDR